MKILCHEKGSCETVKLKSMESMGFVPSQILYVEGDYNEALNQFIQYYYELILDECKKIKFNFIYLPKIYEGLGDQSTWKHFASYFYPSMRSKIKSLSVGDLRPYVSNLSLSLHSKIRQYFDSLGYRDEIRPGLLRLVNESETEGYTFEYFIFDLSEQIDYSTQLKNYLTRIYPSFKDDSSTDLVANMFEDKGISFFPPSDISRLYKISISNEERKINIRKLIQDLMNEIESLGLLNDIIRTSIDELSKKIGLNLDNNLKISHLIMDSDYKITLSDYGSIKIKLTPLAKSLYVLFLRHEEGIFLSHLSDYMPELLVIYEIFSGLYHINQQDREKMLNRIDRLCSSLDNSVHEKISAIRKAFTKVMAEVEAEHYIITGKRGEIHTIKLDRNRVVLPNELKKSSTELQRKINEWVLCLEENKSQK